MNALLRVAASAVLFGAVAACEKKPATVPVVREIAKQPEYVRGLDASKDLSTELGALMVRTLDYAHGDPSELRKLVATFETPDADGWCSSTFGEQGARIAGKLKEQARRIQEELGPKFEKLVADRRTNVEVIRIVKVDDGHATAAQRGLLARMKRSCALYTVNFSRRPILPESTGTEEDAGVNVGSWVYVDGGFRWIGDVE